MRLARHIARAASCALCLALALGLAYGLAGLTRSLRPEPPAWAQQGCDAAHSGSTDALGPKSGRILWSWSLPEAREPQAEGPWLCAGPLVARDGTVYLRDSRGDLWAISRAGRTLWRAPIPESIGWWAVHWPTLLQDGRIAVPVRGGIRCLSPDGSFAGLLRIPPDAASTESSESDPRGSASSSALTPCSSPTVGPDGPLYVGCRGRVVALTPEGVARWQATIPEDHAVHLLALRPDGGVYAAQWNMGEREPGWGHSTLSLVGPTGVRLWTVAFPGSLVGVVVAPDGVALVAGMPSGLVAYDAAGTGSTVRRHGPWAHAAGADGAVLVVDGGRVRRLARDGAERWSRAMAGEQPAIAVDRAGTAYVRTALMVVAPEAMAGDQPVITIDPGMGRVCTGLRVVALDKEGTLRWETDLPGTPPNAGIECIPSAATGLAVADGGRLYVCSEDTLYAIGDR